MNRWIVCREIGQPIYFWSCQEISKLKILNWLFTNNQRIRRMSSGNLKLKSLVLPSINCILTSWKEATWDIIILKYIFLWRVLSGRICCFCSQAKVIHNFLLEITKIMLGNDRQYTKVSNMNPWADHLFLFYITNMNHLIDISENSDLTEFLNVLKNSCLRPPQFFYRPISQLQFLR